MESLVLTLKRVVIKAMSTTNISQFVKEAVEILKLNAEAVIRRFLTSLDNGRYLLSSIIVVMWF